ncbi:uncharacterized protein LOC128177000 [Crassostrea angulata]|uniref:uncharacterized protein LOC128177000 n=1 Tax=Magallana angulata TaxID=2784310 RepID=UPI0022B15AC4|nr:uncharacterized protein LOC128177000 [Crassostrea angulata]
MSIFKANTDSTTLVTKYLPSPIVARSVRLLPISCHSYCGLHFDVVGCEATTTISNTPTTTTVLYSIISTAISNALSTPTKAITSVKPTSFNNTRAGLCICTCTETNATMTPQALQERIDNIVQNLTISKKKTSKYIRSKSSAQDSRPEVVYVGSVAIVILCMFASLIVLPDLYTLLRFLYAMLKCKET